MLCPRCDYDLTGLPESHQCPECGCPYDSFSTAIHLTGRRNQYLWLVLYPLALALPNVLRVARGRVVELWTAGAALLGAVVVTIILVARRAGLPTRLILHREGLELVTPGQEPLTWRWDEIVDAGVSRISGSFWINGADGIPLYSRYYARLGRYAVAQRCATEINNALRRHKPIPSQVEPQGTLPVEERSGC